MLRKIGIAIVALLLLVAFGVVRVLNDRPDLERWRALELPPAKLPIGDGEVRITFLGVSTLVIRDRETTILVDGFFTRPGLLTMLVGEVEPDPLVIAAELERAGVERAAAVIVVHSHFDHVMDAPEVAKRTGAVVVGSESTANVSRGWGLSSDQIVVPEPGEDLRYGGFVVTLFESEHFPHGMAMGEITEPLVPPAPALDYLDGGSFSVAIAHPESGTILVQGSAGWRPGALSGKKFDVVLLGVGGLGGRDDAYRDDYYDQVVESVQPSLVIPIHWDDFTRPLTEPLRPFPRIQDDLDVTMKFLIDRAHESNRTDVAMLPPLREVKLLPRPDPGQAE
jgi:L-ascorbate metabolism protein UlaG (beta-lactamase superfamily)